MASAFDATIDELWAELSPLPELVGKVQEWDIYDSRMSEQHVLERYCRFEGVDFGVAPLELWPELRRDLL